MIVDLLIYLHLFPFCVQLTVNRYLPFVIMGGLSLVTAIVCMTLPETLNEPTIEDLHPGNGDENDDENGNEYSALVNETRTPDA